LFGGVVTPFLQQYASNWLTEIFYLFYASYYFFVPAVGFPLYRRGGGSSRSFGEFMLAVSLTFWICYLHFLLTPAGGPVFWPEYPGVLSLPEGGPISAIERWVFATGTIVGGAFPSSHVAVALVVTIYAWRFRVIPFVVVPLFVGLAVSTVYTGYHYGVDVIYGALIGGFVAFGTMCAFASGQRPVAEQQEPTQTAGVSVL
jgi:membrane-associated phospholipid phosphatase